MSIGGKVVPNSDRGLGCSGEVSFDSCVAIGVQSHPDLAIGYVLEGTEEWHTGLVLVDTHNHVLWKGGSIPTPV